MRAIDELKELLADEEEQSAEYGHAPPINTEVTAYADTKKMIAARDRMLRDAYHGRNGLSMTTEQKAAYRAMLERTKAARRISRGY